MKRLTELFLIKKYLLKADFCLTVSSFKSLLKRLNSEKVSHLNMRLNCKCLYTVDFSDRYFTYESTVSILI